MKEGLPWSYQSFTLMEEEYMVVKYVRGGGEYRGKLQSIKIMLKGKSQGVS